MLNLSYFITKITENGKYCVAYVLYFIRNLFESRRINIKNVDDTINELLHSNKSMIRFGDGEIALIRGFDIRFQKNSEELVKDLIEALCRKDIMVAIPDIFYRKDLKQYKKKDRKAWIYESMFSYPIYYKYCSDGIYYNSLVSRLYLPFDCRYEITKNRFDRIKKLWAYKNLLIVEGEYSRLGVGNDLFSDAKKIDRILCPAKNAYEVIHEIEMEIIKVHKTNSYDLTVLAIGPTAKVLVSHLYYLGRLVDIGHLDIEYEWFVRKTNEKAVIKGKAVNEVPDGYSYIENDDIKYQEEIIARINALN